MIFAGFCSLVRPQVNFNPDYDHLPFNVKMFGPKPKGKENVQTYTWRIKPGAKVRPRVSLKLYRAFYFILYQSTV